jgi:hypothetical protein
MRDWRSFWRGIQVWKPRRRHVNYAVRRIGPGLTRQRPRFWLHAWTPMWHEGRGPYLSVGIGWVAVYRGY